VVTSLDVEGGRQMLVEAAPPSTPRGTSARPVPPLLSPPPPPPHERPSSGRPKTAGAGGPSAAVQAATAAIAASAALSRNPIFLECVPVEILWAKPFLIIVSQIHRSQCHRAAAAAAAAAAASSSRGRAQTRHSSSAAPCSSDNCRPHDGGDGSPRTIKRKVRQWAAVHYRAQ
jgi:hypothetical protein